MRNIATCYKEHAIKVSDSYCSGSSNRANVSPPSIQTSVSSIYKTNQLLINITWFGLSDKGYFTLTLSEEISSRQFKKVKGSQKFESCNCKIEVVWDLSAARYGSGPEPISGFFVAVVVNSELVVLLGGMKDELEARKLIVPTKCSMICRSEYFSGKDVVYSTKAKFCESGLSHEITIRCEGEGEGKGMRININPVLSVCIDKKSVIHVKRLQWNFRGNQTIFLDGMIVDMMWDVRDWLFGGSSSSSSGTGKAVFLFKTRCGIDSRLWIDEKIEEEGHEEDKLGFSLLICATKLINLVYT